MPNWARRMAEEIRIVSTSDSKTTDGVTSSGTAAGNAGHSWHRRERPLRLERRVEFPDYEGLRDFLDRAAELSEETGLYPNLSFGRTYANLTLFADESSGELSDAAESFAERIDALLRQG